MKAKAKAKQKIQAALAVLNRSMPKPRVRRHHTTQRKVDLTCPVCHDPQCQLAWSEEAHLRIIDGRMEGSSSADPAQIATEPKEST